ncbi:hypothetical protein, unlikely [Trypanosoma brucei gambiense DAL972]|uniref:Uncharacterized protein n=1 Tax=Trypanosoma brucei gambiense (strain MHOM/CI/86/DAL972) TaxID=679716 RepID=D0A897_TRYB9|nr:hypothetical protein, unlikely [Trypanosoma brucei gambiense DAL972]CBH17898.1 hypothetical protein, unlikely [Trypanosoma brucei gambiense DAL972]|eukprot:XP_011780162.1 hypothetical protein, unlikely [Trypanosoma brucei gambiense DAL972]
MWQVGKQWIVYCLLFRTYQLLERFTLATHRCYRCCLPLYIGPVCQRPRGVSRLHFCRGQVRHIWCIGTTEGAVMHPIGRCGAKGFGANMCEMSRRGRIFCLLVSGKHN